MNDRHEVRFWLPRPRVEVFDFYADVRNLDRLTPGWLRFRVMTPDPSSVVGPGAVIDYRLRWRRLPLRWRSEITEWRRPELLTYEQRRGPYRFWRHEHRYLDEAGGTRVVDRVEWSVFGGPLVRRWVAADVRRIFAHRIEVSGRLLGSGEWVAEPRGVEPGRQPAGSPAQS